jgi:hypothetical protein
MIFYILHSFQLTTFHLNRVALIESLIYSCFELWHAIVTKIAINKVSRTKIPGGISHENPVFRSESTILV